MHLGSRIFLGIVLVASLMCIGWYRHPSYDELLARSGTVQECTLHCYSSAPQECALESIRVIFNEKDCASTQCKCQPEDGDGQLYWGEHS